VQYNLQPPFLKHLGLDRKIRLGGWVRPVLSLLVAGRRLRGTRLDPFGRTEVRKLEQALRDEYITVISSVAERLTTSNHGLALYIARLPDMVRGYERLKLENAAAYRDQLSEAISRYEQDPVAP
jgi:indolepyruvate ferredoxin oxidoreductase